MEPSVGNLRMPSTELKMIKARIAILTAAINEVEVSIDGAKGKKILPLWSELKTLRTQAEALDGGKTNRTSSPGPGSGTTENKQESKAVGQAQKEKQKEEEGLCVNNSGAEEPPFRKN